ncbi:MAG: histidine kinase dimerization/phospho-acceptor domain-containing protein, partial [Anaerolineae bacterium]
MSIGYLPTLLMTAPGIVMYHLLVLLGLLATAGIIWAEWRQSKSEDQKPRLVAMTGIVIARLAALGLSAIFPEAVWAQPALYAIEPLTILLLVWGFHSPTWGQLTALLGAWSVLLVIGLVLWMSNGSTGNPDWSPIERYRQLSWQPVFWYGLSTLAGLGGAAILARRHLDALTPLFFILLILGVGSLFGLLGMPLLGSPVALGEGIGRILCVVAYPLLSISFYDAVLQDIDTYRSELRSLSNEALRQTQELLFLIEATRFIDEGLNLRAMLGDVVRSVAMALGADAALIVLPDDERRGGLRVVARHQVLDRKVREPSEISMEAYAPLAKVFRTKQQQMLAFRLDGDDGEARDLLDLMACQGSGSLLLQPLMHKQQLLGALVVCRYGKDNPFRSTHAQLATTMGTHIAGAIENTRLYRALAAKAEELASLLDRRETELKRETAILEGMAEGILVSDADARLILMNRAAEEILGLSREQLMGHTLHETLAAPELRGELSPGVLVGLSEAYETSFAFDDRRIHVHAAPVWMEGNRRLGTVSVLRDVTREYLAEEAKREFIASISHALRTPLTAIKGYTEVMLSGMVGDLPPVTTQFLGSIRENTTRMTTLTNNIISVAEIERGSLGLAYQDVDVADAIDAAVKHHAEQLEERHLSLNVVCDGGVPVIAADPNRLRIILDNLLSNAIKFSLPGGEVSVGCNSIYSTSERPSFVSLWVADTGVGIPLEEQMRIWERFYRVQDQRTPEA